MEEEPECVEYLFQVCISAQIRKRCVTKCFTHYVIQLKTLGGVVSWCLDTWVYDQKLAGSFAGRQVMTEVLLRGTEPPELFPGHCG